MENKEKKILQRAFIASCVAIFIPLYVWGNIIAYLPYLANKLNLPDSTLGFLFMCFAIAQIIMSQIAGKKIIPIIGSTQTIIIGILIFSISPLIFGLASNSKIFLIASLPTGIALGMIFPTCTAITGLVELKTNKILQPLFTAFISLGFLFGALSSGIFQYFNFNPSVIISMLSFISLASIFLFLILDYQTNITNLRKLKNLNSLKKKLYSLVCMGLFLWLQLES